LFSSLRGEPIAMTVLLETVSLSKSFGMVRAAENLNVGVREGELVGIVGPNGSGKTTFLNLVTGYLKPDGGRILFGGRQISGLSPRAVTRLGIARSFQIPQLYTGLTVLENVLLPLAVQSERRLGAWHPLHRSPWIEEAGAILRRFGLADHAGRGVSELPEGGRKLLDIALSFALRPRLLLMDEPTAGVSNEDKFEVMDTLVAVLQESQITTIFVEHDMDVVNRYSQRVLGFANGQVLADGDPATVLADPEVRKAVLGRV
jgi:branched-chain amino acid transport system ATP-binding protein